MGNRREKVPLNKLGHILYPTFFVSFGGITEAAVKEPSTAKGHKPFILNPVSAFQDFLHGGFQIIVSQCVRNTAEKEKGIVVALKKSFLNHTVKGFHVNAA